MSRFIITIAPDNADAEDAASAQTTVRVDTSTGHTRITELTIRAADGGGLAPADLPAVDLELLTRALAAPSAIRALPTDAEADVVPAGWGAKAGGSPFAPADTAPADTAPADAAPADAAPADTAPAETAEAVEPSEVTTEPSGAPAPAATEAAPAPRRAAKRAGARAAGSRRAGSGGGRATAGGRAATSKASGRKAAKKAVRKAAVRKAAGRAASGADTGARTGRKATAAKAAGRGRRAAAAGERETRAYRRMPEPADVIAEYARSGSITKLAEHYGVPRHTANGWARRLRGLGYTIGRS